MSLEWHGRHPLPTHCTYCGRELVVVSVPQHHRFSSDGTEREPSTHLRCPKKITSGWAYLIYGDKHDESVVPDERGPFEEGDPGPLPIEIKWR